LSVTLQKWVAPQLSGSQQDWCKDCNKGLVLEPKRGYTEEEREMIRVCFKCFRENSWTAYEKVFPKETHQSVGKETGETAHMERWYNTLIHLCCRIHEVTRRNTNFSFLNV